MQFNRGVKIVVLLGAEYYILIRWNKSFWNNFFRPRVFNRWDCFLWSVDDRSLVPSDTILEDDRLYHQPFEDVSLICWKCLGDINQDILVRCIVSVRSKTLSAKVEEPSTKFINVGRVEDSQGSDCRVVCFLYYSA